MGWWFLSKKSHAVLWRLHGSAGDRQSLLWLRPVMQTMHMPKGLSAFASGISSKAFTLSARVLRSADGYNTGKPVFKRSGDVWTPTQHCRKAAYEPQRKALNDTHIMPNVLWNVVTGFNVQQMVMSVSVCIIDFVVCIWYVLVCILVVFGFIELYCCMQLYKDPVHAYDHDVAMYPYLIFLRIYRIFPQNLPYFSANTLMYLRIFQGIPDPRVRTSDGEISYSTNVPNFFKLRRFGGVEAPEGRENVPARRTPIYTIFYIRTRFFPKIYNLFLQMTTFFSKPIECSIEFSVRWTERRTGPILS